MKVISARMRKRKRGGHYYFEGLANPVPTKKRAIRSKLLHQRSGKCAFLEKQKRGWMVWIRNCSKR